jgi:hypothetical protein
VEKRTYRVTALVGGWRSLPWPFGLFDVGDEELTLRSWHWSWWSAGGTVPREEIGWIDVRRHVGEVFLHIRINSGALWRVHLVNSGERALRDLRSRGYLREPTD